MPSHREVFRRLLLALRPRTAVCDYLVSKQHKLLDLPLSDSIHRLERWQSETLMQQSLLQRRPSYPQRTPTAPSPAPSFEPRTTYGRGAGDNARANSYGRGTGDTARPTRAPRGQRDTTADGPKRKFSAGAGATRDYQRFSDANHVDYTVGCINCAQLGCTDDMVQNHTIAECPDVADWIGQGNDYCLYHADAGHKQSDCNFLRANNGTVDPVHPR